VCGRDNTPKRPLVHFGAFNISLALRNMLAAGTLRELKNHAANLILCHFEWLACRYRPDGAAESRAGAVLASPDASRSIEPRCQPDRNLNICTTGW
jgi:hypothetical protein